MNYIRGKEVYTKCDLCKKEIEHFKTVFLSAYYEYDLTIKENNAYCSIKCLTEDTEE